MSTRAEPPPWLTRHGITTLLALNLCGFGCIVALLCCDTVTPLVWALRGAATAFLAAQFIVVTALLATSPGRDAAAGRPPRYRPALETNTPPSTRAAPQHAREDSPWPP